MLKSEFDRARRRRLQRVVRHAESAGLSPSRCWQGSTHSLSQSSPRVPSDV